jgi:hypothetical protein
MSRGDRLTRAIKQRGVVKMINLALDLRVDESAISRWKKGGAMSLENAARLAEVLDVSLDWIVLGRGEMDVHKQVALRTEELRLIAALRGLGGNCTGQLVAFLDELTLQR